MSWENKKLGDICELKYGKGLPKEKRINGHYPVYGAGGIIDYHNEYFIKGPGIIVGRKGTIGKVFYEKQNFCPIDTVFFIKENQNNYSLKFLYYLLQTLNLDTLNSDAAVPGLNRNVIYSQEIKIPSLATQRKIASILSVYDDLVENNAHRIKILEDMVRTIYKEWFVNFRFPDYKRIKFIDFSLGKIPEKWHVNNIGNYFKTVSGGTPSRAKIEYWDGDIPWINLSKINKPRIIKESEFITQLGLKKSSTKLMPKRTTVIAITGSTLGKVSLLEISACANQSIIGIYDENGLYNNYIYLKMLEIADLLVQSAGGGAQQHINKQIIDQFNIIIPPEDIIKKFNKIITPIFDLIKNFLIKNINLCKAQKLLISKLMSKK